MSQFPSVQSAPGDFRIFGWKNHRKIARESFIGDYTKWHRAQIAQVMLLLLMGA